jgi:hypothetical protein
MPEPTQRTCSTRAAHGHTCADLEGLNLLYRAIRECFNWSYIGLQQGALRVTLRDNYETVVMMALRMGFTAHLKQGRTLVIRDLSAEQSPEDKD